MTGKLKPNAVYHADWGSTEKKRWCAKATLDGDGNYTAHAPEQVKNSGTLIEKLQSEVGGTGCAFAGFDFPIGVPAQYAKRADIKKFRDFLEALGKGAWTEFFSVCDTPEQISVHQPFYPNGAYKGRRKEDLFRGHSVSSMKPLLRRCERGGNGQKQACSLFWTLGGNQVGKAAISGWRDVLIPALDVGNSIRLWPFDGALNSLLMPGNIVIAETYPAECYGWFSSERFGSKRDSNDRIIFGKSLLRWAEANEIAVEDNLRIAIGNGFPKGKDDAFDSVVGLFGMLYVVLGKLDAGGPDDSTGGSIEGWILGRSSGTDKSIPE